MSSESIPGDLTLLGQWKLGDQEAAVQLYSRYVEKLLSLIQRNIARRFASRFDADDVFQSAFRTFFGRVADGRLEVSGHDDVWKILMSIALCKVRNQVKFHDADKRRVGQTASNHELLELLGEPSEQDAVDVADLIEGVIRSLDPQVARTMNMILAGQSQDEIANELGVTTRSVRRYRDQIAEALKRVIEQ